MHTVRSASCVLFATIGALAGCSEATRSAPLPADDEPCFSGGPGGPPSVAGTDAAAPTTPGNVDARLSSSDAESVSPNDGPGTPGSDAGSAVPSGTRFTRCREYEAARAQQERDRVVRFAPVFGDDMVLQRRMPLPVWGTSRAGTTVTVAIAGKEKTTTVGADGWWQVTLAPLEASGPTNLTARGVDTRTLRNVLVGEA